MGRGGRVRSRAGHPRARVWGRQRARESELPNARLQNRLLAPARPPRSVSLCPPTCAPPVRTHNAGVHHQAPGRPAGWPGGSPGPPDDGGLVGGGRAHQRGGGQPGPAQGKKKKKSSDERERGGGATHPAPRGRLRNAPSTATRIEWIGTDGLAPSARPRGSPSNASREWTKNDGGTPRAARPRPTRGPSLFFSLPLFAPAPARAHTVHRGRGQVRLPQLRPPARRPGPGVGRARVGRGRQAVRDEKGEGW